MLQNGTKPTTPNHRLWILAACLTLGPSPGCAPLPPGEFHSPHGLEIRFLDTEIACDRAGHVYVVGTEQHGYSTQIFHAASRTRGESWSTGLAPLNSDPSGRRRRPRVSTGGPGQVYVAWEDTRPSAPGIYLNRSLDGGRTWLVQDVLVTGNSSPHATYPAITSDERGNVYVLWLDDWEGFEAYYLNVSRDHGRTWWDTSLRVTTLTLGQKGPPQLVCDQNGNLYTSWVELRDTIAQVYTHTSHDYGQTWLGQETALSGGRDAIVSTIRVLDSDMVVVAWIEMDDRQADLYFNRSLDRGRYWEPKSRRLTTSVQPFFDPSPPVLRTAGTGHVYIAWSGTSNDGTSRIVLMSSEDSGRSFFETVLEPWNPIAQPNPQRGLRVPRPPFEMAVDRTGNIYFSWTEDLGGHYRVGFDRVSAYGRTWLRLSAGHDPFGHAPWSPSPPRICADEYGHVHLLWNEGDRLHAAGSPFHGDSGWRDHHF